MTESLLPAAIRLTTTAEALAALAAHVRVETEGLDSDPRIGSLLAAIATELTGSMATAESVAGPQVVGMARAFLRDSVNLVDDPGRTGGWSTVDPVVLQGVGRLSMAIPRCSPWRLAPCPAWPKRWRPRRPGSST